MRSGKRILIAAALAIAGAFLIRAELEPWVQHTPAGTALSALFRNVPMPRGSVSILRPPAEARTELTSLITGAQGNAKLYRLRAQEAELALDFAAAETDWVSYAQKATDRYAAQIELADFYHRRMRAHEEAATLQMAATAKDDPLQPATAQRAWQAFERMATVEESAAVYRAWVARYPKEPEAWRKLIEYLAAHRQFAPAQAEIARYGRTFPQDAGVVKLRADLEMGRGSPAAALAVYDRAFQPLWPDEIRADYFKLLEQQGQLREFAGRARTALAANPADLDATARLFHYFRAQNNPAAARRALLEYRIAKESGRQPWTADELTTMAQLFEWLPDVNESARLDYALYSMPPAGAHAEQALDRLANLLLTAPEQPIQFGSGDLSFYQDIATVDPSPGFLNGILSLVLNGTGPRWEYQRQDQKAYAYFHRAAAARLVGLLEQRFPKSAYREPLRAMLITAYAGYGDDATVTRAGREYLAAFPNGAGRVAVAMQISDALARANRTTEEFALYDQLLRELAAKASRVPIGAAVDPGGARSPEYAQVLDKYLSRLAALNRPLDAVRVYRNEIDRNPNDPGLYQRLAAFLEQNNMTREVEETYTKAIAKFGDPNWYHKLARWYLRRKGMAAVERISREAIAVFSGSELEKYFADIVQQTHPVAVLYRQLNLYAHERFPDDLAFVRNLLGAYSRKDTYDAGAAERLLRQYWFYDPQLRARFFERLSAAGRLATELAEVRSANPGMANGQFDQVLTENPAAVQFVAEGEAWLSHFEAAAPAARALAVAYPGKSEFTTQASALYRSLAAYDPQDTDVAVSLADLEQRAQPRDTSILARMGDILADRELFSRARTYWDRMPAAQPNQPDGTLEAATVYWDYYEYNDALRWIAVARKKFGKPALFAYEAGAIDEGKRDYAGAVREYLKGAIDGEQSAENRLMHLAKRNQTRDLVERATAAVVGPDASPQAVSLRVAVLEAQQRRTEIEALLQARVAAEKSSTALAGFQETARRLGFDAIEERASERLAAITNDPVDKMRLTLETARLLESKKDMASAARVVDALYRDHPLILGVVRGAVDFHVRNQQPAEAIDILLDAANHARSDLAAQFTLESARIATAAGQFDRARTLLAGLLKADPLRAEYLTAMADTYLQAKDDRGYRDYELATIQMLKQSQLTAVERLDRISTIRRSLIPALDRLKDNAGAVDQYIEVINNYAEDEGLTREAAAYAVAHGQAARLAEFYRKTVAGAPRDYRWPIVLGRIQTVMEDYPAAIASYEKAIQDRPDRADVLQAKANLEERLMRFDDAVKSYSRLYELAYRDAQWLIKVADLRARLGQPAEAVKALETAIIGARTETADSDFSIAERLETWHLLPEAVTFANRGAQLAGENLFTDVGRAVTYSRIMARARQMDAVLPHLGGEPAVDNQVEAATGGVINEIYTPAEKVRLEQAMEHQPGLLPLAQIAGLVDLEARWRYENTTAQDQQVDPRLVTLQSQRGLFAGLGSQLEEYAARIPGKPAEAGALAQAAEAFIAEGDMEGQMRVMRRALDRNLLSGVLLDRYLALTAAQHPDELLATIGNKGSDEIRNRAVQFALAGDRPPQAYAAVQTRGSALPPVWTRAYTALTGLYFDDRAPAVDSAFQAALDTRTIGERLKTPLKPDSVVVGSVWFYYGGRYGAYLAAGGNARAEEFLPASLEAAPENPEAYMLLGDAYEESAQGAKSTTQFEHALELDPDRGDAHDQIACALWKDGRRAEAITRWKTAIATFLRVQSRGVRVPEMFWARAAETFTDIGERHALGELRGDIAHMVGDYYQRNREYRLEELIEPAARASLASGEGTDWLVELAKSMDNPEMIIHALMAIPSLSDAQRISLQRALVAMRDKQSGAAFGDNRESAMSQATAARLELISMLLNAGDVKGAAEEWARVPVANIPGREEVEVRLAAKTGTLAALLTRYEARPEFAPSAESLRNIAMDLRRDHDETSARVVLEYLYTREIRNGRLDASNFLGLAEVKLQRNDTAAAMALLNRMALVVDDGFETLRPAAELLGKYGKTAESADFLRRRIHAVPWDAAARVQLARTLGKGSPEREGLIQAAANDTQAPYKVRAEAARLSLHFTPGAADQPYEVEARVDAAQAAPDPETKLRWWRGALSYAPGDVRVRLGTLHAALDVHRDNLALALAQSDAIQSDADLAESLAAAAERLDDLPTAEKYLRTAISLRPVDKNDAVTRHLNVLVAEQQRRAANAERQPVIQNTVEQSQTVMPRIVRSTP